MDVLSQHELEQLTAPERIALISQLWDSLDDDQVALTSAQRSELDIRLASLDRDRRESITWEALRAELERPSP